MAANVLYSPNGKFTAVSAAGQTIDFTNWFGAVTIQNLGSLDLWFKFDVAGTTLVAADTNGQIRLLANGGSISFNRVQFSKIGFISTGATVAQAVATRVEQVD